MPQHGPEIPVAQHIIRDHGIILTSALARRFRRHGVGWRSRRPARPGAAHGRVGRKLRRLTAGAVGGGGGARRARGFLPICEGMPAGVEITTADVGAALARRRAGYGRGARMKFEQDEAEITAGVRHGRTLGGPVAMRIANTEWPKWETIMSPDPVDEAQLADLARSAPLTRPRPGHADLAGMQKYGHDDARAVLERASARETAARVALGELARRFLRQVLGAQIVSHVVSIGQVAAPDGAPPRPEDAARVDEDPVRCLDPAASAAMRAEIDAARKDGDTLGGVVEVAIYGLPPGLGSHAHWDRRLDGRLAGAMMSIQAIKGVEIEGPGEGIRRLTNRAGGIEGGMSSGELVRVRLAMKPISTVPRALATIDV